MELTWASAAHVKLEKSGPNSSIAYQVRMGQCCQAAPPIMLPLVSLCQAGSNLEKLEKALSVTVPGGSKVLLCTC